MVILYRLKTSVFIVFLCKRRKCRKFKSKKVKKVSLKKCKTILSIHTQDVEKIGFRIAKRPQHFVVLREWLPLLDLNQ